MRKSSSSKLSLCKIRFFFYVLWANLTSSSINFKWNDHQLIKIEFIVLSTVNWCYTLISVEFRIQSTLEHLPKTAVDEQFGWYTMKQIHSNELNQELNTLIYNENTDIEKYLESLFQPFVRDTLRYIWK